MATNVNADPAEVRRANLRLLKRVMVAVVLIALVAGGAAAAWHHLNNPPRPWLVRWRLQRYLAKKSGQSDFKTEFPFPSKAEMSQGTAAGSGEPKGSQTGKVFESLCDEYFDLKLAALKLEGRATNDARRADLQKREQALEPIVADLWELQRKMQGGSALPVGASFGKAGSELISQTDRKLSTAESYATMYHLIGEELWVADRLLESQNVDHRRAAVGMALAASRQALNSAMDGWVAARICEGYILPALDVADQTNQKSPFNIDNLLRQCADTFIRNNEFPSAAAVYERYLAMANSPQRADWARYQIADAYQQGGDPKSALRYLKQVQNTNDPRLARRIGWLQRQVGK